MAVKSVTVTREQLVNKGNYENVRIGISLTADIDNKSPNDVIEELTKEAVSYIQTEVAAATG